ncbi:MAG TPA: hypothetical protein VLY63_27395 [Anaerolineae bacterium]|nr:hypothetical protein [Anaerolineae bacterium]
MSESTVFQWLRYPETESWVAERLDDLVANLPHVRAFAGLLARRTSSRLVDWLDHLVLADGDLPRGQLADLGFEPEAVPVEPGYTAYHHLGSLFPRFILRSNTGLAPGTTIAAALQVESISHFMMANQLAQTIEGTPLSPYRRARAWHKDGREFLVVERRGHLGFVPIDMPPDYAQRYLRASERWAARPRLFPDERAGMEQTQELARSLVSDLGVDTAAWIAFATERSYWQGRSRAGKWQEARQRTLGLGWANHDHHTFRSSRQSFSLLIKILETLGFHPRERFYAGSEAGWGAQVMEQPNCRLAVFADVDLSPDEVEGDFAHRPLTSRQELGTVGLWCALHGESMLDAGLHHLAGRFDFDALTTSLAEWGIGMMRPFTSFSYLRQAFTRGELWEVAPDRLERLQAAGQIDESQRNKFAEKGAIGSHLENIQRAEGFKGFNQHKISDIIRRTDPRAQADSA